MKSKTKTYLLLALVLAVWGVIGYKIVSGLSTGNEQLVVQNFEVSFTPKQQVEVDTFSINIVNRDPFLGTLRAKKKLVKKVKSSPKKELNWKPVIYHGIIKKNNGKLKLFIISIGGQQRILKIGQVFNEIKLIKGTDKDIVMLYQGKRKTFVKQ